MSENLQRLLRRVEASPGGDERLDDVICATLRYSCHGDRGIAILEAWPGASPGSISYRSTPAGPISQCPSVPVTYSLSAATSLASERLLGAHPVQVQLQSERERGWHYRAHISWNDHDFFGRASTPALSCLAALMRTLMATEGDLTISTGL
jgi:hypothetical protein